MVAHFEEEAAAAGVEQRYDGDFDYFVGGGVAAFDCDDNLMPDLYFAGGTEPAALFVNGSTTGGSLSFTRKGSEATDLTAVVGAYPIDIDSDGSTDLARPAERRERSAARTRRLRIRACQRSLELRGRR